MATIKRKVTLRSKETEKAPQVTIKAKDAGVTTPQNVASKESKKSKKGIWIVVALLIAILCVFIYFLLNRSNDNDVNISDTEVVEQTQEVTPAETEQPTVAPEESVAEETEVGTKEEEIPEVAVHDSEETPSVSTPKEEVPANPSPEEASTTQDVGQNASKVSHQETKVEICGSLDEKARQVIRGNFGNGAERRQKLGDEYAVIQNRVNEMYREGLH